MTYSNCFSFSTKTPRWVHSKKTKRNRKAYKLYLFTNTHHSRKRLMDTHNSRNRIMRSLFTVTWLSVLTLRRVEKKALMFQPFYTTTRFLSLFNNLLHSVACERRRFARVYIVSLIILYPPVLATVYSSFTINMSTIARRKKRSTAHLLH